jgi:hypothetical protein
VKRLKHEFEKAAIERWFCEASRIRDRTKIDFAKSRGWVSR